MNKTRKRIILTVGILIGLFLVSLIIVPVIFKDKIEAAVKAQVNENLNATVDWGEWSLSLIRSFPDASIKVENVKVCNLEPFEDICLADIGKLRATIGVMSLFGDKILIKEIVVDRANIHAKVLADGRANWDIAKSDSSAVEETPVDTTAAAFNIGLKNYRISNSRIIYDDATLPFLLDLAGLQHEGHGDFTQDLFLLSTKTAVDSVNVTFDGVRYLKHAKAEIDADLEMDMANMKFTFKENEARVNSLVLGFDGWVAMPTDDITMDINYALKRNDIGALLSLIPAEFAKDMEGVDMTGKAAFDGYVKGTYNENSMPGFGVNIHVDNGRFKYPDLPASVDAIFVDCKINSPGGADMDGMVVDLKRFALKMAGNPVEARMYLTTPISDPNVDAALKADLDLASVKKVVPIPAGDDLKGHVKADVAIAGRMSDVDAQRYEKFKAEGQLALRGMDYKSDSLPFPVAINELIFDFSPRFLALTNFTGNMGRSDVQANGRLDNYLQWWLKDSTLAGNFNLASKLFDLNELMGSSSTTEPATTEPAPADTVPMDLFLVPGKIDFTMTAKVNEILYDNLKLSNARGGLVLRDERVSLRDFFFNIFDGGIGMNGYYDTKDKNDPRFDLGLDVKGIDIAQTVASVEMVEKMAPIAKACRGKISTDLKLKGGVDQHMAPKMESLNGQGHLRTSNITIEDFKPMVELANVLKNPKLAKASLGDMDLSYEIVDGKMVTKPFDVKIDRMKATVDGSTAFADQAIDYNLKAKVPTDMFGAGANELVSGLLGQLNSAVGTNAKVPTEIDLTAKITGTVEKPVVKPVFGGGSSNLKETIKQEVKAELNERIDKAKEEAIARAREEAAKLVEAAQKQADELKVKAREEAAKLREQAHKAADDEVAKVTNPLAKAAAKIAADKAKEAATKKEQQVVAEADKRADGLVEAARKKGDEVIAKAEATDTTVK